MSTKNSLQNLRIRLSRLIFAMEHSSPEALQKYLKEHPKADPKQHTVEDAEKGYTKREKKHQEKNPKLRPEEVQKEFDKQMKQYRKKNPELRPEDLQKDFDDRMKEHRKKNPELRPEDVQKEFDRLTQKRK